mgnify:CR=1 FL=1
MSARQIHTSRFVLEKVVDGEQGQYYELSNNEKVMKFVTGYALSREESDDMFSDFLMENQLHDDLGRYFIRERDTRALIGVAKLDQVEGDIEIGYRIREEQWGKGIATEIAQGLILFAREHLKAKQVIAFVNIENAASIRVLEKAGMVCVETIEDIDEVKYKFIYSHQTKKSMKTILYLILGLIAIFLAAGLVVHKDYSVEKEIIINKPKAEVFAYLESLENQNNWSTWAKKDPNMKHSFTGTDRTVGFTHHWQGNDEVGEGEQEIKKIIPGERIDTELRFLKPFEATNDAYMITESVDANQTKVKWGFTGTMPYPMNVMLLFMDMEKSVGNDFSQGLKNLKGILEHQP